MKFIVFHKLNQDTAEKFMDINELMACIFCSQPSLVAKLPFKQ